MDGMHSPEALCGILNLNKAIGLTSHDAVLSVRRITGQKKAGHAGTLDPLATGVLLVCLGQATRVSEYLMQGSKVYRARIWLGVTTDTYDAEGQVTAHAQVNATQAQVEDALRGLQGTFQQTPPAYSAVKRDGVPLYKLARRGDEGQRQAKDMALRHARTVHVESLSLTSWRPPEFEVEVHCSKGTYVRSLAHELGQRLGCGAYLSGLVRIASGTFHIEQSVTLEQLEQAFIQGQGPRLLLPMDAALQDYPAAALDPAAARKMSAGQRVQLPTTPDADMCRAYGLDGRLLALLRREADGWWQPHKVFVGQADDESHS